MIWKEFKDLVEKKGVKDNDTIVGIEVASCFFKKEDLAENIFIEDLHFEENNSKYYDIYDYRDS